MNFNYKTFVRNANIFDLNLRKIRHHLLFIFILTMPLTFHLENTEYGYTKTIYSFIFVSLIVLVWLGEMLSKKELSVSFTRVSIVFGLLVVVSLFSLMNASSKCVVLQSLALIIYFFLVYLLVVNTVKSESEAKSLVFALLISGFASSLYGVLQYLGITAGPYGAVPGRESIISMMGNRNYLGGFISYLFIPGSTLIFLLAKKWLKVAALLSVATIFFILFPIGAEGVWLGLIFGFLIFVCGFFIFRPVKNYKLNKVWLILLILVLLLTFLFASSPSPINSLLLISAPEGGDGDLGPLGSFFRPLYNQLIKRGGPRIEDWHIGIEMLKDHPIVGVGLGNYKIEFLETREKFLSDHQEKGFGEYIPRGARTHNEYIQVAAELGFLGIIVVVSGIIYLIRLLFTKLKSIEKPSLALLGLSLCAGLSGFLVHALVSFPAHLPASSLVFVVFLGILNSEILGSNGPSVRISKLKKYFIFVVITTFILSISVISYRDWQANILMGKGLSQLNSENNLLAKNYFSKSVKLDFCPRHTYYYLGIAEWRIGNYDRAIESFRSSLGKFEPYSLFYNLGSLYIKKDDIPRGRYYLKSLLGMGPKASMKINALYLLANTEANMGNHKLSLDYVDNLTVLVSELYERYLSNKDNPAYWRDNVITKEETRATLLNARKKLGDLLERWDVSQQGGREKLDPRKDRLVKRIEKLLNMLEKI